MKALEAQPPLPGLAPLGGLSDPLPSGPCGSRDDRRMEGCLDIGRSDAKEGWTCALSPDMTCVPLLLLSGWALTHRARDEPLGPTCSVPGSLTPGQLAWPYPAAAATCSGSNLGSPERLFLLGCQWPLSCNVGGGAPPSLTLCLTSVSIIRPLRHCSPGHPLQGSWLSSLCSSGGDLVTTSHPQVTARVW